MAEYLRLHNREMGRVIPFVKIEDGDNEQFESMLESICDSMASCSPGDIREGSVIKVTNSHVYFNVQMKNIGSVLLDEFIISNERDLVEIGAKFALMVEYVDDVRGIVYLSREKAIKKSNLQFFQSAKEADETIEGRVCGKVKGGLMVNVRGSLAFLPGSQIDVRPVKDSLAFAGVDQLFKVLTIDENQLNIILSRKAVFESSRASLQDKILSNLEVGQVIDGTVKNITSYGAFIDLGHLDGLLHLTDMSWKRISHPSEMLNIGQNVQVVVIRINKESRRISLGMKQLAGNPWDSIDAQVKSGDLIKGRITNVADYGVFVDIGGKGIEGLVHAFETSWVRFGCHLNNIFKKGQEVDVKVLNVDKLRNRISLSMKRCTTNPWTKFVESHRIGEVIKGVVNNVVDFGVFVTLNGCVDGLVHITDLSWKKSSIANLLSNFKEGDEIDIKILSMDAEKNRIGLGVKQIERDPFNDFLCSIKNGDIVRAKVESIDDNRVEFSILGHQDTYVQIQKEFLDSKDTSLFNLFAVGSEVDLFVFAVDAEKRFVQMLLHSDYTKAINDKTILFLLSLNIGKILSFIVKGFKESSACVVIKGDESNEEFFVPLNVIVALGGDDTELKTYIGSEVQLKVAYLNPFNKKLDLVPV